MSCYLSPFYTHYADTDRLSRLEADFQHFPQFSVLKFSVLYWNKIQIVLENVRLNKTSIAGTVVIKCLASVHDKTLQRLSF